MLLLFSATSGGGIHLRGTRAATPAADSRCLSYCQYPGVPPPADWPGLKQTQSRTTETPNGSKPLTYPTLLVRSPNRNQLITNNNKSILRCGQHHVAAPFHPPSKEERVGWAGETTTLGLATRPINQQRAVPCSTRAPITRNKEGARGEYGRTSLLSASEYIKPFSSRR